MLYWWWLCAIRIICYVSHDGYEIRHFFVEVCWYGYHLVHWSYGNVIGDGSFSSTSSDALRPICLVPAFFYDEHVVDPYVVKLHSKTKLPIKGHMFGPHLVKVRWVTKSSNEGHIFGPHLVEVCSETRSSNKGHISDHIWSKSAARQSPPTRGTIWTTFGWSPLHDKVLQQGAHLVKVHSEIKSSNEGHHFFATFCQCLLRDKFFWWPIMGIVLWPHLAKVRCVTRPWTRGIFSFHAKFGQH